MDRFAPLRTLAALAALTLGAASAARADFQAGTQGLVDIGRTSIDGTSLATATAFNLGNILTTQSQTGAFQSTPSDGLSLGAAKLTLANPTSFSFGNVEFGTFTAKNLVDLGATGSIRSFFLQGTFVSGSRFGASVTVPASLNLSLTANVSTSGTSYSFSATLSAPGSPAAESVPEPASVAMLGLGLVGAGLVARRRRSR